MITICILLLITTITSCNANHYDPQGLLDATASNLDVLEIKDKSGNIILRRSSNTQHHWKLGIIDNVDLSKYRTFTEIEYKWIDGYKWKQYNSHYEQEHDRGGIIVYLLIDPNFIFNGMQSRKGVYFDYDNPQNIKLQSDDEAICKNVNIFCYPNKKEPKQLFEKNVENHENYKKKRRVLLSRDINIIAGHDGFDAKVKPSGYKKKPWRRGNECDQLLDNESCPEYKLINGDEWEKIIWNLVNDEPATTQKMKITWDKTTHEAKWDTDGTVDIMKIQKSNANIYRDKQVIGVAECVLNTVNTLLQDKYWTNKQYFNEFCLPHKVRGFCEKAKAVAVTSSVLSQSTQNLARPMVRYQYFSDKTIDMALAKVGAFEYQLSDVNKLYYEVKTNEPHTLLGVRLSYHANGGHDWLPDWKWGHDTAFPWRGGDDNHWYYANSHSVKPIKQYVTVLDMIQDIKQNFNKFNNIHVIRILQPNSAQLTHTPQNVDRKKMMVPKPDETIEIQVYGGKRNVVYKKCVSGKDIKSNAYQGHDNTYDSAIDVDFIDNNNYDYLFYWSLENELILLIFLSITSLLLLAICCCGLGTACSWLLFYENIDKKIKEFVDMV